MREHFFIPIVPDDMLRIRYRVIYIRLMVGCCSPANSLTVTSQSFSNSGFVQ